MQLIYRRKQYRESGMCTSYDHTSLPELTPPDEEEAVRWGGTFRQNCGVSAFSKRGR